jgi:FkbM family methyltransferase
VADLGTALGLGLYRYGFHAPEIDLVRRILRPGDVFVDGGANVGLFSLVAAACVGPTGRVVCFEPATATCARLRRNLELNRFPWVEVREEALGESIATGTLLSFEGDGAGLSSFAPAQVGGARAEQVRVATLDGLLGRDASVIRLVKLDLEGSELKALRGATALLATGPDLIVELEPEHLRRQGSSAEELVRLLETAGYRVYAMSPSGEWNQPVSSSDTITDGANVLARRDESLVPVVKSGA